MKQIKFNNPENLNALLERTKTTMIRKAWEDNTVKLIKTCPACAAINQDISLCRDEITQRHHNHEKPCKYEIGEEVELIWTGNNYIGREKGSIFGKAKITSIEKIEIRKGNLSYAIYLIKDRKSIAYSSIGEYATKLAKSEGFKSPEQMFTYLENYAGDLSKAKSFWLITYEYMG